MLVIVRCSLSSSDASESNISLPTTPYSRPHSPCIHFFFLHTYTIPLSGSPQPDSTPDLPSTPECIPCRNKGSMYAHLHLSFNGSLRSYSSGLTQIMNLRELSIQTRHLRSRYRRACAMLVSTPLLGPMTSSAEDPMQV